MKNLTSHLERHLGKIDVAWKDADGTVWPFYVLRFLGGPVTDTVTYSTLGLADSPVSNKQVRHELFIMTRSSFGGESFPGLLHQVGTEAISKNRAYLRGDVIGPRGTLITGTNMEALYVSLPIYLPDSFATYNSPEGISCVFAWLIPITFDEAAVVRLKGWEQFENKLAESDPDLMNLNRSSIV